MIFHKKLIGLSIILISLLANVTILSSAYDDIHGIEYNDIVDISFERYIDGVLNSVYDDDNPFQITINPDYINVIVVNQLLGMKVGEINPSIKWTVEQVNGTVNEFEYVNTKIVRIVKDSTPQISPIGETIITIFTVIAVIGAIVGLVFLYIKVLRPRLLRKKCMKCGKQAHTKCAKCGSFICSECSVNGCPSCGSRKYIRL